MGVFVYVGSQPGRVSIVKLEMMSCPKFTGSPSDFDVLIMALGRSDIKIRGNLLHAIPQKHQRLINHLELANHKEMMEVLALEFGRSRLVVDDIVSQIEKRKPITTDKAFLEFVEKMEKIIIDLTTFGKIQAVANPRELSNLEKKLPTLFNIDWHKIVSTENLEEKDEPIVFKRFMEFLKEAKDRIERMTSDIRSSTGQGSPATTSHVNFVTGAVN